MERRLQTALKKSGLLLIAALVWIPATVFAQQPSQKDLIRIQIWAELDAFPGKFNNENLDENSGGNSETGNDSDEKKYDNVEKDSSTK